MVDEEELSPVRNTVLKRAHQLLIPQDSLFSGREGKVKCQFFVNPEECEQSPPHP